MSTTSGTRAANDFQSIKSIPEESLSDAETLIPDVRSISGRMKEDQTDTDSFSTTRFSHPARSASTCSIVRTPTRGLSVVGPVRRGGRISRVRSKNKSVHLELKRSDAYKSIKRRSPRSSTSQFATGVSYGEARAESSFLRERVGSFSRNAREHDLLSNEYSGGRYPTRDGKPTKPRHTRRSSADDMPSSSNQKAKLRVQTNIPRPNSANVSPVARRKHSLKRHRPMSSSLTSLNSGDSDERMYSSPEWSEVDPSDELREALGRAFRAVAPRGDELEDSEEEQVLPRIMEPKVEGYPGEIPLPPEVEIHSYPVSIQSPALRFWGLAISALSEKVKEGFEVLRDMYGAEPPMLPGHVRVRWTCVSFLRFVTVSTC